MRTFLIALTLFLIIDIPYLLFVGGSYYQNLISQIQGSPLVIKYLGAIITYLLMALAVKYLVLNRSDNVRDILFNAFITGLVSYGIYDFTNYATLKDWPLEASLKDTAWGIILFVVVSYFTYKLK